MQVYDKRMTIVITMAGLGSRFRNAGYSLPKYQIEVCGKTLFEWSISSLLDFPDTDWIFVVRKEDHADGFIETNCEKYGIHPKIIEINQLTQGQAETAMLASSIWNKDDWLLIYNIDTYVERGGINYSDMRGDGFIPCFKGAGDHWSFVKINDQKLALSVREKVRISDNCTVGAYYFKTAKLFEDLYYAYYIAGPYLEKERYVAPIYNLLIKSGGFVYISDIDVKKVHVLGTPEEVKIFMDETNV